MSDDIEPVTFVSRQSDVGKGSGLNGKLPIVSVNADVVDGDLVSEKSCLDLEKGNQMLEVGGGTPELNRCASASLHFVCLTFQLTFDFFFSSTRLTFSEGPLTRQRRYTREDQRFERLGVGLRLSIAISANIGGTGTLTGTGPNIVLKGTVDA